MATMPSNDETRKAVCEIVRVFGFDPSEVRSFDIHMATDAIITVDAEVCVEIEQMQKFVSVMQRYRVVPVGCDKDPA